MLEVQLALFGGKTSSNFLTNSRNLPSLAQAMESQFYSGWTVGQISPSMTSILNYSPSVGNQNAL
jgi:hypothetical protein